MKSMGKGLYRSRLAEKPDEIAGKFMSSLEDDQEILLEDIVGTEAHDIMLCEHGIIPKSDLKKILKALEKLRREVEKSTLKIKGEYEDVHEFLEDRVIREAGEVAGGKLHTARSRNDQVVLDIRMKTRTELNRISQKLIELIQILLRKASETMDTPMILYTHTQHAQIGNFAHYLLAQTDILSRDFERLDSCYTRVNRSPLGASAIGGTRFPIDRSRTASLLGFNGVVENSIDAVSSRDFAIEVVACLATLMVNMSRVSEDLVVWSSSEFGYVELADEYASTSSVMPQKKNPCTLELIRGKTGRVCGSLMDLAVSVKGLPTGYSRDLQATKPPLWSALKTVEESLEVMSGAIRSLKVNRERWIDATRNSYAVAVDLAEELTAKGLPFRQSHRFVGELVRHLVERRLTLKDVNPELVAEFSKKTIGIKIQLTDTELSHILDPLCSLEARRSVGSPSPEEVDRMLQERRKRVEDYSEILGSRTAKLEEANTKLRKIVDEYIAG
jgi:argininosuccinate lyase